MLLPRNILRGFTLCTVLLAPSIGAGNGLYGFNATNPYTPEEKILQMDYLPDSITNYRAEMRNNLLMLIDYARQHNPNFQILSHEGQELLYKSRWEHELEGYNRVKEQKEGAYDPAFLFEKDLGNQEPEKGTPEYKYLNAVNAIALNNYYCGQGREEDVTINHGLGHISIEQCQDEKALDEAIMHSLLDQKAVYVFTNRETAFQNPSNQPLINDSARNIEQIKQAKNITFILDDSQYLSKEEMIAAIINNNYDIVVINPLFQNKQPFGPEDVSRMSFKKNGAKRLVLAKLNVSEASPQDYFWKEDWTIGNPSWIVRKSFVNKDGFITRYWSEDWKKVLSRHFRDIVASGYDGVFFTGIENHLYFEHLTPLE